MGGRDGVRATVCTRYTTCVCVCMCVSVLMTGPTHTHTHNRTGIAGSRPTKHAIQSNVFLCSRSDIRKRTRTVNPYAPYTITCGGAGPQSIETNCPHKTHARGATRVTHARPMSQQCRAFDAYNIQIDVLAQCAPTRWALASSALANTEPHVCTYAINVRALRTINRAT